MAAASWSTSRSRPSPASTGKVANFDGRGESGGETSRRVAGVD